MPTFARGCLLPTNGLQQWASIGVENRPDVTHGNAAERVIVAVESAEKLDRPPLRLDVRSHVRCALDGTRSNTPDLRFHDAGSAGLQGRSR